jgi:hypothetical protein
MKSYLLISLSDFPYSLFGKTPEQKFRSLEKYLEKNSIPFDCEDEKITIFVKDEFEARKIGTDFRLKSLPFYSNGKCVELSLSKVIPKRQPRLTKSEKDEPGVITSLKSLRQIVHNEKTEDKLLVSMLMKRRILTRKELNHWVKDGTFHPVVVGRKKYITDEEIKLFLSQ